MGVVRTTFIINPTGEISAIWEKVSVRKKTKKNKETIETLHVLEVKQKLEELKQK